MSSNRSVNQSLDHLIPKFLFYALEGCAITSVNLLIFISILRFQSLREKKTYLLIAARSLADALAGAGYILAGVGRTWMIKTGSAYDPVTSFDCLFAPWNIVWLPIEHVGSVILFILSFDRALSIANPAKYLCMDAKYIAKLLVGFLLPFVFPFTGLVVYLLVTELPVDKTAICYTEWVYPRTYYHWIYAQSQVWAWLSVILYVYVLFKYREKIVIATPSLAPSTLQMRLNRQRRLTVTFAWTYVCTLFFYILPNTARNVLGYMNKGNSFSNAFVPIVGILLGLNRVSSFVIYLYRHADIRLGVFYVLRCAKPSVQKWTDAQR